MNFWLTVRTGISDPELVMDSTLADKVLKKTLLDLQKRFPIYHACPKCLAAHCCGSAFPENGLAFRQDLDEVGKKQWLTGNVGMSAAY